MHDGVDYVEITQMWRLSANPGPCAPKSGALATVVNTVRLDFKNFWYAFYDLFTMSLYATILPYLILGLLGNCLFPLSFVWQLHPRVKIPTDVIFSRVHNTISFHRMHFELLLNFMRFYGPILYICFMFMICFM